MSISKFLMPMISFFLFLVAGVGVAVASALRCCYSPHLIAISATPEMNRIDMMALAVNVLLRNLDIKWVMLIAFYGLWYKCWSYWIRFFFSACTHVIVRIRAYSMNAVKQSSCVIQSISFFRCTVIEGANKNTWGKRLMSFLCADYMNILYSVWFQWFFARKLFVGWMAGNMNDFCLCNVYWLNYRFGDPVLFEQLMSKEAFAIAIHDSTLSHGVSQASTCLIA